MNAQRATEIQAVLEGIALPATKDELIAYVRREGPEYIADLQGLPDEEFRRLDDVGELLTLAVTAPAPPDHRLPRAESGKPPGGDDYLKAFPDDTGLVRHDAPRDNPPAKAIEQASKRQKRQKAAQG